VAGNLEGNIGRGESLDFERGALNGVILEEEVRGGFAEVLGGSVSSVDGCLLVFT
jgi:hypothetical protein